MNAQDSLYVNPQYLMPRQSFGVPNYTAQTSTNLFAPAMPNILQQKNMFDYKSYQNPYAASNQNGYFDDILKKEAVRYSNISMPNLIKENMDKKNDLMLMMSLQNAKTPLEFLQIQLTFAQNKQKQQEALKVIMQEQKEYEQNYKEFKKSLQEEQVAKRDGTRVARSHDEEEIIEDEEEVDETETATNESSEEVSEENNSEKAVFSGLNGAYIGYEMANKNTTLKNKFDKKYSEVKGDFYTNQKTAEAKYSEHNSARIEAKTKIESEYNEFQDTAGNKIKPDKFLKEAKEKGFNKKTLEELKQKTNPTKAEKAFLEKVENAERITKTRATISDPITKAREPHLKEIEGIEKRLKEDSLAKSEKSALQKDLAKAQKALLETDKKLYKETLEFQKANISRLKNTLKSATTESTKLTAKNELAQAEGLLKNLKSAGKIGQIAGKNAAIQAGSTAKGFAGRALGNAGSWLTVGMEVYNVGSTLYEEGGHFNKKVQKQTVKSGTTVACILGGAKLGAMAGAWGGPVGIAIGGIAGGIIGGVASAFAGDWLADNIIGKDDPKESEKKKTK